MVCGDDALALRIVTALVEDLGTAVTVVPRPSGRRRDAHIGVLPGVRTIERTMRDRPPASTQPGTDDVHSVSGLAAPTFAAALLGEGVFATIRVGHRVLLVPG